MAYKITKYAGKHKIKDTKSGKSVDIDIEKYMNGGYKTGDSKYAEGVDFECPPGDLECEERKRFSINPPVDGSLEGLNVEGYVSPVNNGLIEEGQAREKVSSVGSIQAQGPVMADPLAGLEGNLMPSNDIYSNSSADSGNRSDDYSIPNPYAGVDLSSAAYSLGQSIENKSTLGIIGSSAKLFTGLGRNFVSGLGQQNRYNQVMGEYQEDQKNKKNPVQYFAYGGKKDEELATGEYMHGISNENLEQYNAEIEKGEYFQSNEGDIAEVVGDKHSSGGEKVQMEAEDKVLSDKLKLGAKTAKMLSEKYDLKLKAKNTYADVLDKYKKKSKLSNLIEEEADIIKKIGDQDKVEDATTKNFNLEVLAKKKQEIAEQKNPIEEQRKVMFDDLFNIQEESKPKEKGKDNKFEFGGKLESMAKEYGVSIDRAKELIQEFRNGGKIVPKYAEGVKVGDIDPRTGKKVTKEEAARKVASGEWEDLGAGNFIDRGTPGSEKVTGQSLQSYRQTWDKEKFPNFEDYVTAAEQWKADNPGWDKGAVESTPGTPDELFYTQETPITMEPLGIQPMNINSYLQGSGVVSPNITRSNVTPNTNSNEDALYPSEEVGGQRDNGLAGMYLFPDETPLPPSALQGTIKPERRFDRVSASEIDVEPYLQDIKDREQQQMQSLEGLSPNVRAAVLANMAANGQNQESKIRNQVDVQNTQNKDKAAYSNASTQRMEQNASAMDRLQYEKRQYRAQSLTDNDQNNYYNQLQSINKQRFMDIHNLNLVNATNEDVYFDGQSYKRKTSDRDILRQIKV